MTPTVRLTAPVPGTPDPQGLARFHQRLLGWPMRDDEPQRATLRPADGSTGMSFQCERHQLGGCSEPHEVDGLWAVVSSEAENGSPSAAPTA